MSDEHTLDSWREDTQRRYRCEKPGRTKRGQRRKGPPSTETPGQLDIWQCIAAAEADNKEG